MNDRIYIILIGVIIFALRMYFMIREKRKAAASQSQQSHPYNDLQIEVLRLDPPSGSELIAGEPITVFMRYRYASKDGNELPIWVKILEPGLDSTYQGSCDPLVPGEGEVNRYALLNEPGEVKQLYIIVKDPEFAEVYRKEIAVDYRYLENPAMTALRDDGIGSRITGVSFSVVQPGMVQVGTRIEVEISYDAKTEHGVDIYAVPLVDGSMTFSPTSTELTGRGTVVHSFTVTEPYHVQTVRVVMTNQGRRVLQEEDVAVNIKFVDDRK